MKKPILTLTQLLAAASFTASAQTTVLIRPHFNGKESTIEVIDSFCAPSDHRAETPAPTQPIIAYMAWTYSGCDIFTRELICFTDLTNPSVIPAGSTITSATLYLYGVPSTPTLDYGNSTYPGSPYSIYGPNKGWVYELAAPFDATTVTWKTQPAALHTDSVAIPQSDSHWGTSDSLDVTALVTHLFTSGNNGFLIKIDSEIKYREHLYASSYYSDSSLHPALKVTYTNSTIDPDPTLVGILEKSAKLNIWPNPCTSVLNVTNFSPANTPARIRIYNTVGELMYTQNEYFIPGSNKSTIPVDMLPAGLYVLEVKTDAGNIRDKFYKK